MSAPAPWYRQGWPWLLILLPLAVVVASLVTLYLALRTDEALVRDDYYREGLAINRRLEEEAFARTRGIGAQLRYDAATQALELTLRGAPREPAALTLLIVHPTDDSRDQSVTLSPVGEGVYAGRAGAPLDGKRYLQLRHEADGAPAWRLRGTFLPGSAATAAELGAD